MAGKPKASQCNSLFVALLAAELLLVVPVPDVQQHCQLGLGSVEALLAAELKVGVVSLPLVDRQLK